MIGYNLESHGTYRILIPETSEIICSRDVIFEEGVGHCTLTAEGEYFADSDSNDRDYLFITDKPTNSNAISPSSELPPPTEPPTEKARQTPTCKDYGPPTCRSTRIIEMAA